MLLSDVDNNLPDRMIEESELYRLQFLQDS